jgi:hypothetical protein
LADLEAYDDHPSGHDPERRYLCPFCGDSKPRDDAHRSLAVNTESGAYTCHRGLCHTSGKLSDFWTDRKPTAPRARSSAKLKRAFELPPEPEPKTHDDTWRGHLHNLQPLQGTAGAEYLAGRAIPCNVADGAGARFSPAWLGRGAVVFPIYNSEGQLVAAQGRYIDGGEKPKARTAGPKSEGVFMASWRAAGGEKPFGPLDPSLPAIIVAEAPIDALSLAAAGLPAIAFCGTSAPHWLHRACAFRRVCLAFDADAAGDHAAEQLAPLLGSFGATCERLRPDGAKDWNEMLLNIGAEELYEWLLLSLVQM